MTGFKLLRADGWRRYDAWIAVAASGALIAIGYGFALGLPFFFDDLPIMTWLGRHDWLDIWTRSSENAYYRPLAFTVYKLGLLLPVGARQVALHAVPLLVHWIGAILVAKLVKMCDESAWRALLAGLLFSVFPFLFLALPWVTALSHPLVTMLALLAVYAALRAVRDAAPAWWVVSLLATALAPFAHESGPTCGLIVGGVVLIQHGFRAGRRWSVPVLLGIALNVGAVLLRGYIPGVGEARLLGLEDGFQNLMFFLHGLLYPLGPIIGWLTLRRGWHDFTLIGISALALALLLLWLVRRSGDWRWVARSLWWWVWGALPAAASLKFGDLFISPRLHALASAGIVMLWAGLISELARLVSNERGRRLAWSLLAGVVILQNLAFLNRERGLFVTLNRVHRQVLRAAEAEDNAPLGFVNLPAWLAYRDRTYALVTEGIEFVPPYSNIGEFIQVNLAWRDADGVMFTPVLRETEQVFGFRGPGLNWEEMRRFALDHGPVWLTHYQEDQFVLKQVGTVKIDRTVSAEPLVRFTGGPLIESASVRPTGNDEWAVALTWLSTGPVDGEIFVHVRDARGRVVTQADGPALGGMVPLWLWQPGDRIYDVRHVRLPDSSGPYTVQVGVYDARGRFPAFMDGGRASDDAAPVATILP